MRLKGKVAVVTGSARDVGEATANAWFLVSDESRYITGDLICCDGGRHNCV